MIVCEVGLNHCGNVEYANEYVKEVIKSESDAILFHIREKSFYEEKSNKKKKLPDEFYIKAINKIHLHDLKFGITISDIDKIQFCENIGIDFYKVLSQDIKNSKLIKCIMETKKPFFISTGLSDLEEISTIVDLIKNVKERVTLIHTQLRSDLRYVNLKAIPMLQDKFDIKVAFRNHSENSCVTIYH